MKIAKSVSVNTIWNKDWFFVYKETEETQRYSFLKVEMDVGDSVEDEWMVACILMEVSSQIDDVAVILWVQTHARSNCRMRTGIFFSSRRRSRSPTGWIQK